MCAVIDETPPDTEPTRRRFTVDEFERMGEAGIFAPDERVELIDGEVIEMTPVGPRHVKCVFALEDFLRAAAGPELRVVPQNVLELPDAKPWPDMALLRRSAIPGDRIPGADACVLAAEVADPTGAFDRGKKRFDHARAEIPEYWVLDLRSDSVVVHLRPAAGDYRQVDEYGRGETFASPALGGREIRTDDLLV